MEGGLGGIEVAFMEPRLGLYPPQLEHHIGSGNKKSVVPNCSTDISSQCLLLLVGEPLMPLELLLALPRCLHRREASPNQPNRGRLELLLTLPRYPHRRKDRAPPPAEAASKMMASSSTSSSSSSSSSSCSPLMTPTKNKSPNQPNLSLLAAYILLESAISG